LIIILSINKINNKKKNCHFFVGKPAGFPYHPIPLVLLFFLIFAVLFSKKNVGKPAGFPYHPIPLVLLFFLIFAVLFSKKNFCGSFF
jgi:hypothetical protein